MQYKNYLTGSDYPLQSYERLSETVKTKGIVVNVGNVKQASLALIKSLTSKQFIYLADSVSLLEGYLAYDKTLVEQGKLRPMLDKVYKTSEVQEAIHYCVDQHPQGKVVIEVKF